MRFNCLLTLFFLLNSCWQVQPIKKYFRSSFQDVNRAQLWSAGRLPCVQDKTVVLPDHFVFYFSSPLTGQSIVMQS